MGKLRKIVRSITPPIVTRILTANPSLANLEVPSQWTERLSAQEREEMYVTRRFDVTAQDIAENERLNAAFLRSAEPVETVNWFVPHYEHVLYGGVYTILRFAAYLQERRIDNNIIIYDRPDADLARFQRQLDTSFPILADKVKILSDAGGRDVPPADACIATLWHSAYLITKLANTRAKYYFIQDYEPLFYPAGVTYGLAEATYRFGLLRIVNTPGLLQAIEVTHGGGGMAFVPCVDREVFFPDESRSSGDYPVRIFFYGRPSHPRNGFMLGIEILRLVKERCGAQVKIICAGAPWNPSDYGADGVLTNIGLLDNIAAVAALYRSCDIGLSLMFTKHPSYQPFEFMASGCCVVANRNSAAEWLLKDDHNCLLTEPTVEAVAETICSLVDDAALRRKLAHNGLITVGQSTWNGVIEQTCAAAGLIPRSYPTSTESVPSALQPA